MTTNLFIDFEGQGSDYITEMGVVAELDSGEIAIFHHLVKSPGYNSFDKFIHCISRGNINRFGTDAQELESLFIDFINSLPPVSSVYGHGRDISEEFFQELFPSLSMKNWTFVQAELDPWIIRQDQNYHKLAGELKSKNLCPHHDLKFKPHFKRNPSGRKIVSISQRVRNSYGFHCAQVDAWEIYFKIKECQSLPMEIPTGLPRTPSSQKSEENLSRTIKEHLIGVGKEFVTPDLNLIVTSLQSSYLNKSQQIDLLRGSICFALRIINRCQLRLTGLSELRKLILHLVRQFGVPKSLSQEWLQCVTLDKPKYHRKIRYRGYDGNIFVKLFYKR